MAEQRNTPPKHLTDQAFENYQEFIARRSGLHFTRDRTDFLEQKLLERMAHCKFSTFENYFFFLSTNPEAGEEINTLMDNLTIGETYFMRNKPHFDVLQDHVLRDLSQKTDRTLKIWSAGCSTGEEPYSIAMALREYLPDWKNWNIQILATDLNREALALAREGVYSRRSIGEVPSHMLDEYFKKDGTRYKLSDEIKNMVTFDRLNLITDALPFEHTQDLDILFCRNVTIYFSFETLKQLVSRFYQCLRPGGYFFIGHAETLWNVSRDFFPLEFPQTFIYQKRDRQHAAPEKYVPVIPISIPVLQEPEKKEEEKVKAVPQAPAEKSVPAPQSLGLMGEATALANEEKFEEAIACLKKVVEKDNLHISAYYLLGVLNTKLERWDAAISEFRRLLYIDPDLSLAYFNLGNLYAVTGKTALAEKEYANALRTLQKLGDDVIVPFSSGMAASLMRQAIHQAREGLMQGRRVA